MAECSSHALHPDLKHSSTEGPISINNHSVTLADSPNRRVFKFICLLTYLLTYTLNKQQVVQK